MNESLFIKACLGIKSDRPPIWFMRQAGRYLPEYRAIRSKHSMLEVIQTPELAAEVTLQPINRFNFDAAIIFADILNILIGMGIDLEFKPDQGPVINNPIRKSQDIKDLKIISANENVGYTLEAIKLVCNKLGDKPLIGFAGAPFTLSCYLIEGQSPGKLEKVKDFMFDDLESWQELQIKLVAITADYLISQVKAGVSAIQIFDSWVGSLSPYEYDLFVKPYLLDLFSRLKAVVSVPIIYFAPATAGCYRLFLDYPVNVMGIDWRIALSQANKLLEKKFVLQGNLDPLVLAGNKDYLAQSLERIVEDAKELGAYIFNLGHGIMPNTPIANVEYVVDFIRNYRC